MGGLGVISFFVISGFFISQSFENNSVLRFCMARLLRIYPGLLVVLLFTVLVIGPLFTRLSIRDYLTDANTISYVPHNLSLKWLQYDLPGVFATNPYPAAINGSLWSLFYEVACYGIVVAVGALGISRRRWWFCAFLSIYASAYFGSKLFSPVHNYLLEHTAFMALHGFDLAICARHGRLPLSPILGDPPTSIHVRRRGVRRTVIVSKPFFS
ncbi:peptidoglycan/LPS O-acetylase OafA/YrhL [Bradyrhizobium sp. GM7.3]